MGVWLKNIYLYQLWYKVHIHVLEFKLHVLMILSYELWYEKMYIG